MESGKIIVVANQKGGVAKTSTVRNLSYALAEMGKKVLVVDFDPQYNLTTSFGVLPTQAPYNTSPFSVLSQWLIGDEVNVVEDFQKQYGYNQQLGIYEKDYIDGSGQSYEGVIFTDGATEVVYYNQLDERWADLPYGTDNIGGYGCGPTSMAIVVSSLTDQTVDPPTMAEWAYQHGYWCSGNGSYHSLIPGAAEGFGLQWESISTDDPQAVVDALASGKLIVALMSKGHFTSSGHFMVLRGVTSEGKILVADPASKKRSEQEWDISIILDEARKGAAAGGPLWAIY